MRRASRHGTNTLTAKVTDRLRRAILDAEFALGEALSEDSLATALGVSRTPVREALSALQLQGLIVIEPQRGSYVFSPSEQDVDELCAFRRILEIEAMRLCFVHQREATVAQLQWASTEMEAAKRASDHLKVARADGAFHEALLENSGNQYLVEAYKLVSGRVAALRARNLTGARSVRSKAMAEHRAIIEAFAHGDLPQAEAILTAHILKMRDAFHLAKQRGILSEPAVARRRTAPDIALTDV